MFDDNLVRYQTRVTTLHFERPTTMVGGGAMNLDVGPAAYNARSYEYRPMGGEVVFHQLSLERRGRVLLDRLDATVKPGEILAVMGRSGAGKTTLLRTIAGLVHPTSGRIQRATTDRVPVVFQDARLLPWRTARQNIELVLAREDQARALDWLARVGLADIADAYPMTLSGGMRQRVSIARALACQEPLLLVDEPFSHLDIVTARNLRTELTNHIRETGTTTIWVTHDPAEAAEVAERTLVMDGPPDGAWWFVDHTDFIGPDQVVRELANALTPDNAHMFVTEPR